MSPQISITKRRGGVCHASAKKGHAGDSGAHYFSTQSLRNGDGCCILPGEVAAPELRRHSEKGADPSRITALRRELAQAEQALRARTRQESTRVAQAERDAWREARDSCHTYDRIRCNASARLEIIRAGGPE